MNRRRLPVGGFVAVAFCVLVVLLAFTVYKNPPTNKDSLVKVVLAAHDLQVGTTLSEPDIRLASIPANVAPRNACHSATGIIGRRVILPIESGEFILPSKLAAENAGSGLPSLTPPGMRAVPVRVNDVVAMSGFVAPGTRVDVLLTGNPIDGNEPQTTTILEDAAVIAESEKLERNAVGEPQIAAVITLVVSPDDAQKLTLAGSQGSIQLALRNPLGQPPDFVDPPLERPFRDLQRPLRRKLANI